METSQGSSSKQDDLLEIIMKLDYPQRGLYCIMNHLGKPLATKSEAFPLYVEGQEFSPLLYCMFD